VQSSINEYIILIKIKVYLTKTFYVFVIPGLDPGIQVKANKKEI